ncbi:probable RNA helicase armi [Venturia canescens]|uniref:probable RNA helicase armi n=1 Tax=Venturia canescens TaxID=32260 RepID=UPI001C9D6252|nr:probable RNA helicase armi [Venturia canescens]
MFSLLVNATKYILGSSETTKEPNIEELVARLNEAKETLCDPVTVANDEADNDPEGCFYTTGIVTNISTNHVLIDKCYMCESANVNIDNLEIGNKVYYMGYQKDENKAPRIRKIISRIEENWDEEYEPGTEAQKNYVTQAQMIKRSIVAKVERREGRQVFLEPGNISVNLDKVESTFVPYIGDWLKLESLVEVDEESGDLAGEVLEIDNIQPLRSKLKVGTVTKWGSNLGAGTIDRDTLFNKASCETGYVPHVGDKVVSDSIESDQGIHTWRSLTVVPLNQVSHLEPTPLVPNESQLKQSNLDELYLDKQGIVIKNNLTFDLNVHEEQTLAIEVENTGNMEQILTRGCFMSKKAQSQLSLVSPGVDEVTRIPGRTTKTFVFKCRAKFVGTTEELFIFIFRGFKIGRTFRITVNAKNSSSYCENLTFGKANKLVTQRDYDQGNYVQGIRPCKPPSFIAVRNGVFRVPQRFWDAVLPSVNEKKTPIECEFAASEAIPCLTEGLRLENYTTRFHALLYLEEISLTIDIQRYDIDSAVLRHHGEYLSLTVPGLVEKRPSLIVGDRAIISFNWDDSQGKLKYEGFIHKIKSSEVLLKFNQRFHETYNSEECQVAFKSSYSSIARCHNAVNLAVINLGPEILFPTRVVEKDVQINLTEAEPKENSKSKLRHSRSESVSSVCSNGSVASTSDASLDGTNRKVRISVAERLFQTRPNYNGASKTESTPTSPENISKHFKQTGLSESTKSEESKNAQNNSINNLSEEKINSQVGQLKKRNLEWYNKRLNYYQKIAVRNILKGVARPLPYVIFGPPGTGKTITLCEAILQIVTTIPESRLLIATPSNSSANLISERLLDSGVLKPGDLVRLVAQHCLDDDSIPERLLPYCATGNLAAEWSVKSKTDYEQNMPKLNCTMSVLGRHRITVGTCIALGLLYNMGFPRGHFTHILVDEAGQATEPEIMVPLNFVHSSHGQIVLAGDPMQLGPVVNSKLASHFGLGESFLSRLLHQFPYQRDNQGFEHGYDPRLVTKLVYNYRSLPEILELPNSLFYDSELIPQVSPTDSPEIQLLRSMAVDLPERAGHPPAIVFHGVNGENLQDPDSPSWYNPAEATQAYLYLLKLYDRNLSGNDIGIITPYKKQVRQIRDLLMELDIELPKVGSVEEFQGQERKVIILSTVRSTKSMVTEDVKHALGFVASPKRLNVALTRARALLIILGNPTLLSQDPYWRSVLIHCLERESYTGCNFTPAYSENEASEDLNDTNLQ